MKLERELLRKIEFFQKFNDDELDKLLSEESFFSFYQTDEFIIREGDSNNCCLFVLIGGEARVTKLDELGQAQEVGTLPQGAIFGEMSFITRQKRFSSVLAATDCTVLKVDPQALESMDSNIHILIQQELIRLLVLRLDQSNTRQARKDLVNQELVSSIRQMHKRLDGPGL
ncbi:cyclic nucleotide-binding domain-containing protein [Magnetococcus marinus]|uniref:cyclic nucleotide-binding domain-containing protein n=1 Tax=Magnetococcus marinus TaxID=1124597 RepID=UPI00030860D1|nr:cyclic nucleotide-binding domain-containing protein [Magnetococcus marinus]